MYSNTCKNMININKYSYKYTYNYMVMSTYSNLCKYTFFQNCGLLTNI